MENLPIPGSADDPKGVKTVALIIGQALQDAGWKLGALRGMVGEEEVLFDDAVQYWIPGQKDIDQEVVPFYAAQMVALWYPPGYTGSDDLPPMVQIQIGEG